MGEIVTTEPINLDQLREALGLEANPSVSFPSAVPEEANVGEAFKELLADTEVPVRVVAEGISDAELRTAFRNLEYDPDFGRPGRAVTTGPVNLVQLAAAAEGAVTLHANNPASTSEEKTVEVAGATDGAVAELLKATEYDPDFAT